MQNSMMIVVGGQYLVNTAVLAECFEKNQDVLDLLSRAAEQGEVQAYDHKGETLTRLTGLEGNDVNFCLGLNDLRRYFNRGRGGDSELTGRIEDILAQLY